MGGLASFFVFLGRGDSGSGKPSLLVSVVRDGRFGGREEKGRGFKLDKLIKKYTRDLSDNKNTQTQIIKKKGLEGRKSRWSRHVCLPTSVRGHLSLMCLYISLLSFFRSFTPMETPTSLRQFTTSKFRSKRRHDWSSTRFGSEGLLFWVWSTLSLLYWENPRSPD